MKRWTALLLGAVMLLSLLCGCKQNTDDPMQPYVFYYRTQQTAYDSADGVISGELRDLGGETAEPEQLLREYLNGPQSQTLVAPFSKGVTLVSVRLSDKGVLEISLGGSYSELLGINASIADACITRTMLQLEGVSRVNIHTVNAIGTVLRETSLTQKDLVLFDDGSSAEDMELTLYFADSRGRYLLVEKRTIPYMDARVLPKYIVEQLIEGPKMTGLYATIPESTTLLDINVENGVCSVDFSADFIANKPESELQERVTLLSVVNSLTALDGVDAVQLYVEGQLHQTYLYLNISDSFVMDSKAIGPVRPDLNEVDSTIYLPCETSTPLHTVPLRVKQTSNESREEAVLNALLNYPSMNGLVNPIPQGTQLLDVILKDGICTVTFSKEFRNATSQDASVAALRSVSATLTALKGINAVRILVEGEELTNKLTQSSDGYSPSDDWFCALPET